MKDGWSLGEIRSPLYIRMPNFPFFFNRIFNLISIRCESFVPVISSRWYGFCYHLSLNKKGHQCVFTSVEPSWGSMARVLPERIDENNA